MKYIRELAKRVTLKATKNKKGLMYYYTTCQRTMKRVRVNFNLYNLLVSFW